MARREDPESKDVTIVAHIVKDGLHLRQGIANAKFEDGRELAVDLNVDGALLITIHPADGKGWKTYVMSVRAVIDGVMAVEDAKVLPEEEKR